MVLAFAIGRAVRQQPLGWVKASKCRTAPRDYAGEIFCKQRVNNKMCFGFAQTTLSPSQRTRSQSKVPRKKKNSANSFIYNRILNAKMELAMWIASWESTDADETLKRFFWCLLPLCELEERCHATSGRSHDETFACRLPHASPLTPQSALAQWWWCCIFSLYFVVQTKRAYS